MSPSSAILRTERSGPPGRAAPVGVVVASLLFLGLLWGAATFDPTSAWPSVVGDEATYLMAAQSLAWDGDLRYSGADHERFVALQGRTPEGLILQSPDRGATLVYGKPAFYPAFLAPFVRVAPVRGPAVANALLLLVTALLCARALREVAPAGGLLLVAFFVFGSVAFVYAFWAHADLFLMCLVALSYAALVAPWLRARVEGGRAAVPKLPVWRIVAAGLLMAVVVISRPVYLPLALPLFVALRGRRRWTLLGAGVLVLLLAVPVSVATRGSWTSYGGARLSFYDYTGFPSADGAAEAMWQRRTAERGTDAWTGDKTLPFTVQPLHLVWNALYLAMGRHVGIVPYFLPAILCLAAFRGDRVSWTTLLAVAAVTAAFLVLRPFNFWGGGGAVANRYLLPVYPALWFLVRRPLKLPALLVAAAVAGLFLWPSWTAPRGFVRDVDGTYHHVSAAAERVLLHETTQRHLKPAGRDDFNHGALWIKPLSPRIVPVEGGEWIELPPGEGAAPLLLGYERRLVGVRVEISRPGTVGPLETRDVRFRAARAVHPMWWRDEPFWIYRLDLRRGVEAEDGAVLVRLSPVVRR